MNTEAVSKHTHTCMDCGRDWKCPRENCRLERSVQCLACIDKEYKSLEKRLRSSSNSTLTLEETDVIEDPVIVRQGFPVLMIMLVALIGALLPMWPYQYYIVLRVVISVGAVYLVYLYRAKLKVPHCIFLVILALTYNPIVLVRLDEWTWTAVDVASLLGLFWILSYLRRTFIQEESDLDPSDSTGRGVEQTALLSGDNLFSAVVLSVFWVLAFYFVSSFLFLDTPEMVRATQAKMTSMEKDFKQPRKVEGIFRGLRIAEHDDEKTLETIFVVGETTVYLELPRASEELEFVAGQAVELYDYRNSDTVGWQPVSRAGYYWSWFKGWVAIVFRYLSIGFGFLYLLLQGLYTLVWEVGRSIYSTIIGKMTWLPYYRRKP